MKKRLITAFAVLAASLALGGCAKTQDDVIVLRIANCEEYIDLGDWDEDEAICLEGEDPIIGENSLVSDFEEWYSEKYGQKVRVEYSTYGTNEELYNQMSLGNTFDLVCPSEYMIMKLMSENRLEPLSKEFWVTGVNRNFYSRGVSPYIDSVFHELKVGDEVLSDYAAGYMWGTMGIVYKPEALTEEEVSHWSLLTDPAHYRRITMKDSVRDSYFVGLCILNEEKAMDPELRGSADYEQQLAKILNDTSEETVDSVEKILSDMRNNAYSMETDSGKADMVSGKVIANMQWSGDAVYTMDQAEEDGVELCYSVPEECSNLWFDGWVMLKAGIKGDEEKKAAAEAFINFISRPDNVIRNMYYIGYTSAISGGGDERIFKYIEDNYGAEEEGIEYDLGYFFGDEKGSRDHVFEADPAQTRRQLFAAYPTGEVLRRCAVMRPFMGEAADRISQMWINVRCVDVFTKH